MPATPGAVFPTFEVSMLNGERQVIGAANGRWQLIIVYRGKHCGRCKKYLNILESMQDEWAAAGFDIVAVSADPIEKVNADIAEFGWTFPIGYGMTESDMRHVGVHISDPLTPEETDRRFAEPGTYCLRPDGTVQIVCTSNGPSARPDLAELLDGMIFTINNDKPARGTVE